jgi:hypothetical protein
VSGDKRLPIPQQAPSAFNTLEALLPTLKRKRFYGAVIDGEYRACVAVDDDTRGLDLPRWTLPPGRYAVRKIADWEQHRDEIGPTVSALRNLPDLDWTRPITEFYRSQSELRIFAPVSWEMVTQTGTREGADAPESASSTPEYPHQHKERRDNGNDAEDLGRGGESCRACIISSASSNGATMRGAAGSS